MALETNLADAASGVKQGINADGFAKVVGGIDALGHPEDMGGSRIFSENDPGAATGKAALRSPETSADYRLRVGIDTVLKSYTFNAAAQDTGAWKYLNATMTATAPGAGTWNIGTVQGTANGHGACLFSEQMFTLVGTAPLSVEFSNGLFTATLVAGEVCAWGLGIPTAAALPNDGVFLYLNTTGLHLRQVFNTTIADSGAIATLDSFAVDDIAKFAIVIGEEAVEVWKDDVLLADIAVTGGQGQPFQSSALPVFFQKLCTGAVSNTNTFRTSDCTVSLMDVATNLPFSHQMCFQGLSPYQGMSGGTMGSAQFVGTVTTGSSPATATAAAGSNTTAGMTGLGGLVAINAPAAAATDLLLMAWTNPAGGINQTPRTLMLTGFKVSTISLGAAVATTPTTMLLTIGMGSTAATLVTVEQTSFTTITTKMARRIQIGYQSIAIGAVVGSMYNDVVMDFAQGPPVTNPGEVLQLIAKVVVGTATAAQTIHFCVTPIGYFI